MNKKKYKTLTLCVLTVLFAGAFLIDAQSVSEGIKKGLAVSAGVLIPSLFPFMALCGFISASGIGRALSRPFAFLTKKLFRLPGECGSVVLLSLIGGYPAGARMISELLAQKIISEKTAERMLCFCVNAGPPFMLTAVGAGMFLSREAGIVLLVSQIFATLIIGAAVPSGPERDCGRGANDTHRGKPRCIGEIPPRGAAGIKESPQGATAQGATAILAGNQTRRVIDIKAPVGVTTAFVQAVAGAAASVITLCAFAVFFSGILEMVKQSGIIGGISALGLNGSVAEALVCGFFEVTSGCLASARVGGAWGLALASMSISFGGISVIFQVMSFFRDNPVKMRPYLLSRLAHMALSSSAAVILYGFFCRPASVLAGGKWAEARAPEMLTDSRTAIMAACLIGMSTILLFSFSFAKGKKS